ncbi:hypothetical protein ABIA65_003738 [Mycolicibacterium sp. 624]|uniref:DUF732 domain-containing protein n=2 Tax=unclassified Mycolicibacterium TaxID=2636767 RepID=UPI003495BE05
MKRSMGLIGLAVGMGLAGVVQAAPAGADQIGYLVNVTVRPGYNFANGQAALDYGYGLCGRVEAKQSYADMAAAIKSDFRTSDEHMVSYLLSQATQELCPGQIWQLRQSAVGYRAP